MSTLAKTIILTDGTSLVLTNNPIYSKNGIPCIFCKEPIENFMALINTKDYGQDPYEIDYPFEASTMCPSCRFNQNLEFENHQLKTHTLEVE